jgi:hypothetical protein
MAVVSLDLYDCEDNKIPPICMECGEETDSYVTRTFSWTPPWVYFLVLFGLIGIILAVILSNVYSKRQTLDCPLCPAHRNHWSRRTWMVCGIFLLIPMGIAAAVVVGQQLHDDYTGIVVAGCAVFCLVVLITMAIVSRRCIRAQDITDVDMVLVGVHKKFRREYRDMLEVRRLKRRRKKSKPRRDDEEGDGYDNEDLDDDDWDRPRSRRRG